MSLFDRDACPKSSCVCQTAKKIEALQNKFKKNGCVNESLFYKTSDKDTVPIILFNCNDKPFEAFGDIGDLSYEGHGCFLTHFFRVEDVDSSSCCATLSLLKALDEYGCVTESICDTFRLEKTDVCIEVDLQCFCAIQCASPKLIDRPLPIQPKC